MSATSAQTTRLVGASDFPAPAHGVMPVRVAANRPPYVFDNAGLRAIAALNRSNRRDAVENAEVRAEAWLLRNNDCLVAIDLCDFVSSPADIIDALDFRQSEVLAVVLCALTYTSKRRFHRDVQHAINLLLRCLDRGKIYISVKVQSCHLLDPDQRPKWLDNVCPVHDKPKLAAVRVLEDCVVRERLSRARQSITDTRASFEDDQMYYRPRDPTKYAQMVLAQAPARQRNMRRRQKIAKWAKNEEILEQLKENLSETNTWLGTDLRMLNCRNLRGVCECGHRD